mmetsp:Transcript_2395/g.6410  ORF Transcript_2395/g.6410 Transcript_2395/m.6410 type:complete len:282 (-) Transcript_2395:357-1202(-)
MLTGHQLHDFWVDCSIASSNHFCADKPVSTRVNGNRRIHRRCQAEESSSPVVEVCSKLIYRCSVCRPERGERRTIPIRPLLQVGGQPVPGVAGPQAAVRNALRHDGNSVIEKRVSEGIMLAGRVQKYGREPCGTPKPDAAEEIIVRHPPPRNHTGLEELVVLQCARQPGSQELILRQVCQEHGVDLVKLARVSVLCRGVDVGSKDAIPVSEPPCEHHRARRQVEQRAFEPRGPSLGHRHRGTAEAALDHMRELVRERVRDVVGIRVAVQELLAHVEDDVEV